MPDGMALESALEVDAVVLGEIGLERVAMLCKKLGEGFYFFTLARSIASLQMRMTSS